MPFEKKYETKDPMASRNPMTLELISSFTRSSRSTLSIVVLSMDSTALVNDEYVCCVIPPLSRSALIFLLFLCFK